MKQQDIGRFIAEKRRARNLTQEQLAELLGVSNKTVSKWETGKSMPDYSIVELLCKELNITISELIAAKEKESESTPIYTKEQVALLLYKAQQMENKKRIHFDGSISKPIKKRNPNGVRVSDDNQLHNLEVGRVGNHSRLNELGLHHLLFD